MSKLYDFTTHLIPVIVGSGIVLSTMQLENAFFPVIDGFHVTQMTVLPKAVGMSGYLHKRRDCTFIGITATGLLGNLEQADLNINYTNRQISGVRPAGSYPWGLVIIQLPDEKVIDAIELDALHDCHPFWTTRSHLATVPIYGG